MAKKTKSKTELDKEIEKLRKKFGKPSLKRVKPYKVLLKESLERQNVVA